MEAESGQHALGALGSRQWFWIEKSDYLSKRTMAYVLVLLALSDTGAKEGLPVITIQAN